MYHVRWQVQIPVVFNLNITTIYKHLPKISAHGRTKDWAAFWKTQVLYSKHKILEILNLFKLSVAKFTYSFYSCGLPNHCNNYFLRLHQSTNIKPDLFVKILFTQNENVSWSAFFKVRKFGLTYLKICYLLHLIHLENSLNTSSYLARIPVDLRFICCHIL